MGLEIAGGVADFNFLREAMHGILNEIAKNSKRGFSEDSKTDDKKDVGDFPSNQAGPSLNKTIIYNDLSCWVEQSRNAK